MTPKEMEAQRVRVDAVINQLAAVFDPRDQQLRRTDNARQKSPHGARAMAELMAPAKVQAREQRTEAEAILARYQREASASSLSELDPADWDA
jgi:hypothetical protein